MGFVTITIEGLSTSYFKNGIWNVIFPCDGNHRVLFDYHKSNDLTIKPSIPLEFKKIKITAEKFVEPASHQDAGFDKVLDLTSNDLHKEGLKFAEKSTVGKTFLTVEHALFYTGETRGRSNSVRKKGDPDFKPISGNLASQIGIRIELENTGQVKMAIEGEQEFTFEDGDTIHINNYCFDCENDFDLYQDIFENVSDKSIKFEMKSDSLFSGSTAFFGGPPPAFCDGTQIGKPDGLS
ncbi:MAG: hypothetical protein ACR2F2_00240 [Pyrinomonadaceae bacterium]